MDTGIVLKLILVIYMGIACVVFISFYRKFTGDDKDKYDRETEETYAWIRSTAIGDGYNSVIIMFLVALLWLPAAIVLWTTGDNQK